MGRRALAALAGAALLAHGCAISITTPAFREGEEVLRAVPPGAARQPAQPAPIREPLRSLAVLAGADETSYRAHWNPRTAFSDGSIREGIGVGFLTGLNLLSALPLFVATPPVIAGIMGAATAAGAIAGAAQRGEGHWKPTADHRALEAALGRMRPEAEVRERFREAVERVTGRPPPLASRPAGLPRSEPPDYGALARGAGADAVADLQVVAFGLAGGEMAFSLGVFAVVRARVFRASDGVLVLDKVIGQSTEGPLSGAPPPGSYTLELLALDEGRVFRHEVAQALATIAQALATDPDLRLARAAPAAAGPPAR